MFIPPLPARLLLFSLIFISTTNAQQSNADDDFIFTNEPVPDNFSLQQRYPDRPETEACRPIRVQISRGSRRFLTELVTNDHPSVQFANADARIMSLRLRRHLNELAETFRDEHNVRIAVSKAWSEANDSDITDPTSLHFEGRTVRVTVETSLVTPLLHTAIDVGFDWVVYENEDYVRLSVIPNLCDVSLDMVFMLDRSGSVGQDNFNTAISFLQNVVGFYDISMTTTQVSLVTYSTAASIEFDLNDYQTVEDVQSALDDVLYTKGWTATALALSLARFVLDPLRNYGARPFENGIPKVAVLLTDGRSNQLPIRQRANALRNFGVQVYTVGIGDINVPELQFIASDPDRQHVFILNSFNDAQSFVDRLSLTTCDTPAVVDPGENTRTEIEEDEFRFFESRCAAFSDTVMIEQFDLVGRSSMYASWSVQNPGPLDPNHTVVRNEDMTNNYRSLQLNIPSNRDKFVYVSVRGRHQRNEFSLIIWDMIFGRDEYFITILDNNQTMGQLILNLVDQIRDTNASFNFEIRDGNDDNLFSLTQDTGLLTAAMTLTVGRHSLNIVAQNIQHSCHRSKVVVNVIVVEETIQFNPIPRQVSVSEDATVGTMVTQITATSSSNRPPTYSIIAGDPLNQFDIDSNSGVITVSMSLNFEDIPEYSLTVQATGASSTVAMATQVVTVTDVNESPQFVTECAIVGSCVFSVAEGEPANVTVGMTIIATDPDTQNPSFSNLVYSISIDSVPFQISNMGDLTTTETLDFESVDSYTFTVVVMDTGEPASSPIETMVTVNVSDVEENAPPSFLDDCSLEIFENEPIVGFPIFNCPASDPDHLANEILYEIVDGNVGDTFRIDPTMGAGVIVTNREIDREDIDRYNLTLRATDPEELFDETTFQVTILDMNDSPPLCEPPSSPITISSGSLPGSPTDTVATFTAVDPDMNPSAPVYSVTSQTVANDFLSANVTVTVTDGEDASLSTTCSVQIQFQDPCEIQDYSIEGTSGQLRAALLCSAQVNPPSVVIRRGRSRQLTCDISANVPTNHQFLLNGTLIPAVINSALVLRDIDFINSGDYTCRVTNDQLGSIISSPSILEVLALPEFITTPTDVTAMATEMAIFSCTAFGVPEPTITWLGPDSMEPVDTTDPRIQLMSPGVLTILNLQVSDTGSYTCRAENSESTIMTSATLTVIQIQQLVSAEVSQYSLPSQDGSCHEFNNTHFNELMTTITELTVYTTDQQSNDLCPPSPCNPSPCHNGGRCVVEEETGTEGGGGGGGGYVCDCPPYTTGPTCSIIIDSCSTSPCRNGGSCSNSSSATGTGRGGGGGDYFVCSCLEGFHGNRCQYTDVCSRSPAPCGDNETCLETVVRSEGYICLHGNEKEEGVMVTVDSGSTSVSMLDEQVNLYIETATGKRRRRKKRMVTEDTMEDNDFVNVCEGKFVRSSNVSANTFQLVWACPMGVASPNEELKKEICDDLISQGLVLSCTSELGGRLEKSVISPLPPSRINITFIAIDSTTLRPLSAATLLNLLEQVEAIAKLRDTRYQTERFTAVAPTSNNKPHDRGGVIGGVIAAAILLVVVIATALVIIRYYHHHHQRRRRRTDNKSDHHERGPTVDMTTFSNHYIKVPGKFPPPPLPSNNRESVFDDPVYDKGFVPSDERSSSSSSYHPPVTKRRSLEKGVRTSLERGMKLIRTRGNSMKRTDSASAENLLNSNPPSLDGDDDDNRDYDDITIPSVVATPPHVTTPTTSSSTTTESDQSELYANVGHLRGGGLGNAGQRWQSYWENKTLLRTDHTHK